jgi:protein O-mannosyl-transferase
MKKNLKKKTVPQAGFSGKEKKTDKKIPGKNSYIYFLAVFLLPVLLYLQTVKFGFTDFDDYIILSVNGHVLSDFQNAPKVFTTDAFMDKSSPFYRPVQVLSYMVDYHFSGADSAKAYHLTNVLLFGLIACTIFLLLKKLKIPPRLAFLATLLYSVHPLFVTSVAWLPSRGDLLLALFSILSFIFLIEYLSYGKTRYLVLHWIGYTLALFCKETAAFLPFLFILYYFTQNEKIKFEKKYLLNIILYGISGIAWFWIRSRSIGNFSGRSDFFIFGTTALLDNLRTIPESLTSFLFPFSISVIPGFSDIKLIAGLLILCAIIYFTVKPVGRSLKEKLFSISWFLLFLIPTMMLKHVLIDYLNHRFLLPFIGILMFLLFLPSGEWLQKYTNRLSVVLVVLIAVFTALSFSGEQAYSDPMTFYNTAIAQNPNSAIAYNNRGWEKMSEKDYAGGLADFNASIRINDHFEDSYMNKGISEFYLKNYPDADASFDKAIAIHAGNSIAWFYKGMIKGGAGKYGEAADYFSKAVAINPDYLEAYEKRSIAKFFLKDYKGAIEDCEKVLRSDPENKKAAEYKARAQQELQAVKN